MPRKHKVVGVARFTPTNSEVVPIVPSVLQSPPPILTVGRKRRRGEDGRIEDAPERPEFKVYCPCRRG